MPLANLSQRFYQKFGHDLVEELVSWLNQMDATYRSDLRELNELNFTRFDAKLEQRIAEVRAEVRQEIAGLRSELTKTTADLRESIRSGLAGQRADLIKWMFVFWAGNVGILLALFQYFRP